MHLLTTLLYPLSMTLMLAPVALQETPPGDPWKRVRDLKGGTELRVFKKGNAKPVDARMDELTEESLRLVVKNEQVAIPREDIDRIDARPQGGSRITKQTVVTQDEPAVERVPTPGPRRSGGNPAGGSSSSSVSIGGKPDFEVVYRRPPGPPPKARPE